MTQEILKGALRKTFGIWQFCGIHVTPNYFESPIPDTRSLRDEVWSRDCNPVGIDMRESSQIDLLDTFVRDYKAEYDRFPHSRTSCAHQYYIRNSFFQAVDGEILYCMIRHFKPKRIYEVGCGNSTFLSAQSLLQNASEGGPQAELVAFEPAPNDVLKKGFPGLSKLEVTRVEDVPIARFQELDTNDILFLDSSHVLRIGGDVRYEFLEILPNLNPGVIVHVHDIYLPAEYPKKLIMNGCRFFTEQYLLQAFLAFNKEFEVLWGGSFMHLQHPDLLNSAFSSYNRDSCWPGSFWMRRVPA